MTQPELDECRALLQSKRTELIEGSPAHRPLSTAAGTPEIDPRAMMLRNVRSALVRIDEGSFGECLICHRYIPYELLAVTPWATWCLVCRKAADARSCGSGSGMEETLVNAGDRGGHRQGDA